MCEKMKTDSLNDEVLIESRFIQELMEKTDAIEDDFLVTAGSVIRSFFDFLRNKKQIRIMEWIDFWAFDAVDKLQKVKDLLRKKHAACKHKYKKIHYLYIISRVQDRIHELQYNTWKALTQRQKLNYILQPADVALVEYGGKKVTVSSFFSNMISQALKYFSHSVFSHVGLMGNKNTATWFDRLQSTWHVYYGRRWVRKLPLAKYLKRIWPCELLLTRYQDITADEQKEVIQKGEELFQKKTAYDTWDALADITWIHALRSEEKVNCGEFIYKCLKTIDENFDPTWRGVPAEYLNKKQLQQIYLVALTEKL